MTNDGTIYFSSNRNCMGIEGCDYADLFCARANHENYENVELVEELSTPYDEESVFVSPNEEYLIFCKYTNSDTWMDLYISYRNSEGVWQEPQILDSTINSADWDRRPYVSYDNKYLFFTRLEIGEKGLSESDIYWVNTSKVFKPYVYKSIQDTTITKNSVFKLQLSENTFQDINDPVLSYELLMADSEDHSWLVFHEKNLTLTGKTSECGSYKYILRTSDRFGNHADEDFTIVVE